MILLHRVSRLRDHLFYAAGMVPLRDAGASLKLQIAFNKTIERIARPLVQQDEISRSEVQQVSYLDRGGSELNRHGKRALLQLFMKPGGPTSVLLDLIRHDTRIEFFFNGLEHRIGIHQKEIAGGLSELNLKGGHEDDF